VKEVKNKKKKKKKKFYGYKTHSLSTARITFLKIPNGTTVVGRTKSMLLKRGGTAATANSSSLKAAVASLTQQTQCG